MTDQPPNPYETYTGGDDSAAQMATCHDCGEERDDCAPYMVCDGDYVGEAQLCAGCLPKWTEGRDDRLHPVDTRKILAALERARQTMIVAKEKINILEQELWDAVMGGWNPTNPEIRKALIEVGVNLKALEGK